MLNWSEFKQAAPEIAAVGEKLMHNRDTGDVAILATVDRKDRPEG